MIGAICNNRAMPADNTDRLAKRLKLTDPQKAALKDLTDASSSAAASATTALCTDEPDLSTTPRRAGFAEKMMETRLAGLKAVDPKLQAFYDSPGAKQKAAFDTGDVRLVGEAIAIRRQSALRNFLCSCAIG